MMMATVNPRLPRYPAHPIDLARPKSAAHVLCLACVWITFATSGVVFSEPAPVDVLTMGLMILLPVVGLATFNPMLLTYMSLWLVAAAAAFLATTFAVYPFDAARHTTVSMYLYAASFIFAAFVARRPVEHTKIIMSGWLFAAIVAATAGYIGYAGVSSVTSELFLKFDRVAGTFKDPNVFGPFLVPPFLYCLYAALHGPLWRSPLPLAAAGFLACAVLLSFSRGAWFNLALATVIYAYLAFVTASSNSERTRITSLTIAGLVVVIAAIVFATQFDAVAKLLDQRASLEQSYDQGPDGRFGGQLKAMGLILSNPFGIGALQFSPVYHHEEVHNVYLSIVLNAGWLGGGVYWIMVALTMVLGFRHLLKVTASRPLFLIAYAAFVSTALQGVIIDTDHWRHFYVLMAIVWGIMSVPREANR
jgi:O-antigen ligase